MTAKKDLKKRVHERQEKTGERYTTALKHVLDARGGETERAPGRSGLEVELYDATAQAARVGLVCQAFLGEALTKGLDAAEAEARAQRILEQLRGVLDLAHDERSLEYFRRVLLFGERSYSDPKAGLPQVAEEARRFFARLRAGLRPASPMAGLLAFDLPSGEAVVAHLMRFPRFVGVDRPSVVVVRAAAELLAAVEQQRERGLEGGLGTLWVLP